MDTFQANKRRKLAEEKISPIVVKAIHDLYPSDEEGNVDTPIATKVTSMPS